MITEVMNHLNNHFIHSYESISLVISKHTISGEFGKTYIAGQYIYILGSILNDGAYKITEVDGDTITLDATLQAETSSCTLWGCRIPTDFISIVADITAFHTANSGNENVAAEKVGNHSVTYVSGADNTWQSVFRKRLNRYRKMHGVTDFEQFLRYGRCAL